MVSTIRNSACAFILLRQIVAFEDVEHLDQRDAAGGGRRHRDDVIAAISPAHRLALDRAIVFQIVRRHHAAGRLHRGGELFRDRAFVKRARSVFGDRSITCRRGPAAPARSPVAEHAAVGFQKNLGRGRPARQPRPVSQQRIRGVVGDRNAVARQRDRRRHQIGEREMAGAVFRFRERQPRDCSRHADGKRGVARLLRIGVALRIEERRGVDRRRRGLAIVDHRVVAAGAVDHHESAAADIAGTRIGHRHGEADRDRRIDRVAALLENLDADPRRQRLLRHHHAVRAVTSGVFRAATSSPRAPSGSARSAISDEWQQLSKPNALSSAN